MISFVCSTKEPKEEFKQHIIKMCGLDKKNIEFLFYENKNEFSLTQIYNRGLEDSKYNIVVYLHDDIFIETNNFGSKILKHFSRNPEYGILGVAGTTNLESGCWWKNKNKMVGIVNHRHDGKQWVSKYSEDIGNKVKDVVTLDGLFFVVNKEKIKEKFDERFNGFHFYDLSFCFRNYITGVKLGLITDIRVTHLSIGITNEQWENNKILFEELYGDKLPVKLNKIPMKEDKVKLLISTLNIADSSVETKHIINLIENLPKDLFDISVVSNTDASTSNFLKQKNIKTFTLHEPPGYKLGDGKWLLKTPNGDVTSQQNTLYKLNDISFDLLYLTQKPIVEHILRLYPNIDAMCHLFDNNIEEPIISTQIKKYVTDNSDNVSPIMDRYSIGDDLIVFCENSSKIIDEIKKLI